MPYFAYAVDGILSFLWLAIPIALSTLLGVTVLGIAWGGRRAGMLFGLLALASSLLGLGVVLVLAPQLWWITVIPIAIGIAATSAWYRNTSLTSHRLRFHLRGLFTVVLLICLVLGGITAQSRQRRIEEAAAATLRTLSQTGRIEIQWNFGRVSDVIVYSLRDPTDFDEAADALEQFSQLGFLQINDPLPGNVTQRLGRLKTLRTLVAQNVLVTDDDLRPLAGLQNLENLELEARDLTDAGLPHLLTLQQLRVLNLYNANRISPAAMKNLRAGLPRLDNP